MGSSENEKTRIRITLTMTMTRIRQYSDSPGLACIAWRESALARQRPGAQHV